MELDLASKRAIVAGGGAVAAAVAEGLAANGARVERLPGLDVAGCEAAIARLGGLDICALAVAGDEAARIEAVCRTAAGAMGAGGRIVIVTSALGVIPARGDAGASAAAAAALATARALALELGPLGILVNAVAVGAVEGEPLAQRLLSHTPVARAASPAEAAAAALFLCDPDNTYTNGHVLVVDGGWAAGFARNF